MSHDAYQIFWEKQYQQLLKKFLKKHATFTGGEVCRWMRAQGLGDPIHHNMWGAQITYYAGQQWFKKIGSAKPNTKHTHINEVGVWESAFFGGKKKPPTV